MVKSWCEIYLIKDYCFVKMSVLHLNFCFYTDVTSSNKGENNITNKITGKYTTQNICLIGP